MMDQLGETLKQILDTISLVSIAATLLGWLPPLAAALGIAWYCVLFYDRFVSKRRDATQRPLGE
jgi:hypothetical protein